MKYIASFFFSFFIISSLLFSTYPHNIYSEENPLLALLQLLQTEEEKTDTYLEELQQQFEENLLIESRFSPEKKIKQMEENFSHFYDLSKRIFARFGYDLAKELYETLDEELTPALLGKKEITAEFRSYLKSYPEIHMSAKVVHYQKNKAEELLLLLPSKGLQKRAVQLLQKSELLDDDRATANFTIQLSRTLRYYFDIPPFSSENWLYKQFDLLDGVVKALYIAKTVPLEKFPVLARRVESATRIIKDHNKTIALYKQRSTYAKEAFMWEISSLLDLDHFIAPSSPIFMHGQMATYQPFMKATSHGQTLYGFYEPNMEIKQDTFWLGSLLAMLFGHRDMHTQNIGITKKNEILFWDNESILPDNNSFISLDIITSMSKSDLNVPFICYLNDWPQATAPLNQNDRSHILSHIKNWVEKKEYINDYLQHPYTEIELTQAEKEAFFERFDKITSTLIAENISLQELTPIIYPHYGEGMDLLLNRLAPLVSNPDIKMMQAYLFIGNVIKWWKNITPEQKVELVDAIGFLMENFLPSSFFQLSEESFR